MNTTCEQLRRRPLAFSARELRIAADLAMLGDAREWAGRAARDFGLAEDETFEVRLAASEAVTNAIVHGSSSRSDRVLLHAREESGALVFEVRDCGGSARQSARERLAEGGRGLDLVEMVMDEVELTRCDEGSVLRFVKRSHS